jgi:hypothetical protein
MNDTKPVERMYRACRLAMNRSDSRRRHGRISAALLGARARLADILLAVRNGQRPTGNHGARQIVE